MQQPSDQRVTRYKLLKDLPGYAAGTIFVHHDDSEFAYAENHTTLLTKMSQIRPSVAESNPDWFQPIPSEQERPYPWEPNEEDDIESLLCWVVSPSLKKPLAVHYGEHGYAEENAALYRTVVDAELRLKAEPLVNAAVKALLNRHTWRPREGGAVWQITAEDMEDEYHYAVSSFELREVRSYTKKHVFPTKEDAQAVADLYNFFLTTSHAA